MMRFTFKLGMQFREGAKVWSLIRHLLGNRMELLDEEGKKIVVDRAEINRKWLNKEFVIDTENLGSTNIFFLTAPLDLYHLPEKIQKKIRDRHRYIKATKIDENIPNSKLKTHLKELAEVMGHKKPPSESTILRWWRRFRTTQCITSLISRVPGPGGIRCKTSYQIFLDVINELPTESHRCIKTIHERVEILINRINADSPNMKMKSPALSTIYRWYHDLDMEIIDKMKLGTTALEHKYRAAYRAAKAAKPLSRVEIDNTPLDVIVYDVNTNLPIGRPWLTVAIDRRTRAILGFYISFNPPSAHSVLQCLKRVMLPKESYLTSVGGINNEWFCSGIPVEIVVDNGMDLHSTALRLVCRDMGIEVSFCRPKTPWWKGCVERFFRTCNEGLIHLLPGTTFSNVLDRGDYSSEKLAAITMQDLEWLLTKWIVDVYHQTPLRRYHMSPYQIWLRETGNQIIEWPADLMQLDNLIGIPATRTAFHYGIEINRLFYNCPQLQALRNKSGKNPEVLVKYFDDQITSIHILDEGEKHYFEAPIKDEFLEYATGLTLDMHRIVQSLVREQGKDPEARLALLEAKAEIQHRIKQATKSKKMRERKNARAMIDTLTPEDQKHFSNAKDSVINVPAQAPIIFDDETSVEIPDYSTLSEAFDDED